jgi:hypothetical protein
VTAVVLAGAATLLIVSSRPEPAPPPPAAEPSRPAPRPAPRAEPKSAPPEPDPAPRSAPPPEAPPPVVEASPPPAEVAADAGVLHIESDVPGAQVFIDRQFIGATPIAAENLKPGTHQLNVSAEGFESVAREIEVAPGERELVIKFKEVRLASELDVVHKHRVGSCRGRLVATPQGLRYETANKEDAFKTGLVDLETFQVDYLEKNLRVKLPKGRQFNFTDPDGNADRLFVFHRDVEKARERLRKGDRPATE